MYAFFLIMINFLTVHATTIDDFLALREKHLKEEHAQELQLLQEAAANKAKRDAWPIKIAPKESSEKIFHKFIRNYNNDLLNAYFEIPPLREKSKKIGRKKLNEILLQIHVMSQEQDLQADTGHGNRIDDYIRLREEHDRKEIASRNDLLSIEEMIETSKILNRYNSILTGARHDIKQEFIDISLASILLVNHFFVDNRTLLPIKSHWLIKRFTNNWFGSAALFVIYASNICRLLYIIKNRPKQRDTEIADIKKKYSNRRKVQHEI